MNVLMITRTVAEFANQRGKIREIAKLGVDLTVVSPPRWAGRERELQRVKPEGYELLLHDCWFSGTRSVRVGNHLHFYPGISKVIGREKWDLVHVDEEPFNLATFHALKGCREHGRLAIFTTWQNLMKAYPPPFDLFEEYVFRNSWGALAGNTEGLALLRRRGFSKPAAYIPQLGVDPIMFRKEDASGLRRKLGLQGAFVVGFVGRMHLEKGLDTLLKALAMLPENCRLVLVAGRGPYWRVLKHLVRNLGLVKRVLEVPWVESEDVPQYMNAFDVLVLPSRTRPNWKEQLGRVLLEAMACETCVVGSDSGEIPHVIGDAGLVFHEGDAHELAGQLLGLMENSSLRETLSVRGRKRVLERFTYAKIAADTVNFYRWVRSGDERTDWPDEGLPEPSVAGGGESRN